MPGHLANVLPRSRFNDYVAGGGADVLSSRRCLDESSMSRCYGAWRILLAPRVHQTGRSPQGRGPAASLQPSSHAPLTAGPVPIAYAMARRRQLLRTNSKKRRRLYVKLAACLSAHPSHSSHRDCGDSDTGRRGIPATQCTSTAPKKIYRHQPDRRYRNAVFASTRLNKNGRQRTGCTSCDFVDDAASRRGQRRNTASSTRRGLMPTTATDASPEDRAIDR